jgi:hypothetical protein
MRERIYKEPLKKYNNRKINTYLIDTTKYSYTCTPRSATGYVIEKKTASGRF